MKTINWTRKAVKQLNKINHSDRVVIKSATNKLADFPNVQGVKSLTNHKHQLRLRVGNYRVFFNTDLEIIEIMEVKKRDERTY